jgi:hypothetical protein
VTSLACGPAEEVFDAYAGLPHREVLKTTLIDFDLQALAFVADRRERENLGRQMSLMNENLLFAVGRGEVNTSHQPSLRVHGSNGNLDAIFFLFANARLALKSGTRPECRFPSIQLPGSKGGVCGPEGSGQDRNQREEPQRAHSV